MPIQFVGLKNLTETEKSILERVYKKTLPRIERDFKNANMRLIIKKYEKEGKRAKFSLHSKINAPSIKFASRAYSWTFATALHKIFDRLETEINKKTNKSIHPKRQI